MIPVYGNTIPEEAGRAAVIKIEIDQEDGGVGFPDGVGKIHREGSLATAALSGGKSDDGWGRVINHPFIFAMSQR